MIRRAQRYTGLAAAAALATAGVVFAPPAVAATCQGQTVTINGTAGNDQLLGTPYVDVIAGGDGNDVIKGLGGNDVICAGPGNDGVNGGGDPDSIQGGDGYDLIVGDTGNDTIQGGNGSDAIYGSGGTDTIWGGKFANNVHTDTEPDYIAGGGHPLGGEDVIAPGVGDEIHLDKKISTAANACPPQFAWKFGTYAPGRLVENSSTCVTITGAITNWHAPSTNDGDAKFDVYDNNRWYKVEFMPRDKPYLPNLGGLNRTIRVMGAWTTDNHGNNEIHPVYAVDVDNDGVWDNYSGPENAGSPASLRPEPNITDTRRFCWDENGNVCAPWNLAGEAFH